MRLGAIGWMLNARYAALERPPPINLDVYDIRRLVHEPLHKGSVDRHTAAPTTSRADAAGLLSEYDKIARQCASEGFDHVRYLLRLAFDRPRAPHGRAAHQGGALPPYVKSLDSFDFVIPSLNKGWSWSWPVIHRAPRAHRDSTGRDRETIAPSRRRRASRSLHIELRGPRRRRCSGSRRSFRHLQSSSIDFDGLSKTGADFGAECSTPGHHQSAFVRLRSAHAALVRLDCRLWRLTMYVNILERHAARALQIALPEPRRQTHRRRRTTQRTLDPRQHRARRRSAS